MRFLRLGTFSLDIDVFAVCVRERLEPLSRDPGGAPVRRDQRGRVLPVRRLPPVRRRHTCPDRRMHQRFHVRDRGDSISPSGDCLDVMDPKCNSLRDSCCLDLNKGAACPSVYPCASPASVYEDHANQSGRPPFGPRSARTVVKTAARPTVTLPPAVHIVEDDEDVRVATAQASDDRRLHGPDIRLGVRVPCPDADSQSRVRRARCPAPGPKRPRTTGNTHQDGRGAAHHLRVGPWGTSR